MFIADGAFAVAGGRNIANEYFFHDGKGYFLDFDLLLAGAARPKMQAIFDTCWHSPHTYALKKIESTGQAPQAMREHFETPPGGCQIAGECSPPSDGLADS